MKQSIYIADDEINIRELLKTFLESSGYDVKAFSTGEELVEEFKYNKSDLVILDIMMPGKDGLECCKEIRNISNIPIIMLTAKDSEFDYVQGITTGSDDYLTKPFRPTILLMKVKALLRRMEMSRDADSVIHNTVFGDLCFNSERNTLSCKNRQIHFTRLEQRVLVYMMNEPHKAYSRDEFLEKIWEYPDSVETRVVDEMLRRIRKKLLNAESSVTIETIWGFGYQLKNGETNEKDKI